MELQQEIEGLSKELGLIKQDEIYKEASLLELRRHNNELVRTRAIDVSILINKPKATAPTEINATEVKLMNKSKSLMNNKATKNLQFAKELNLEMEQMFADDSFQMKPSKRSKKAGKRS